MIMKKLLSGIDVAPIYNEIDMNLWEDSMEGHNPVTWKNTSAQFLINYKKTNWEPFKKYVGSLPEDVEDIILPDFWPTENYFYYPQIHQFLLWFKKTYGGKLARVMYYNTTPKDGVKTHADGARPSGQAVGTPYELANSIYSNSLQHALYHKKERFSLVISGEYMFTVDEETECFKEGDLWWFDNRLLHSSYNHGDINKINLIFDVEGSRWRE